MAAWLSGCHASDPSFPPLKSGSTVLVSAFDAGLGYFWRQLVESGRVSQKKTRDVDLVE